MGWEFKSPLAHRCAFEVRGTGGCSSMQRLPVCPEIGLVTQVLKSCHDSDAQGLA